MSLRSTTAFLTILGVIVTACGSPSAKVKARFAPAVTVNAATLALDYYPNSDHGGIYSAMQYGYFRQHGIIMRPYVPSDPTAQISLVAAGRTDFGLTYETDLLSGRARGIPVKSVMCIMQHPLNTVMALRRSGITRPRDLAGKTIGIAGSPSDMPIISTLMRHDGASIGQARLVNVGYNLLPTLLAGKVDAVEGVYWTWEAIQARMKGDPVNVIRLEKWGFPNDCELVLIANDHTIATRPRFVRDVVAGMQQGYAYAAAHPVGAWRALTAGDASLKHQHTLVIDSLELLAPIITDAPTIGFQNGSQWRAYAHWLAANHLIASQINADQAFTNRFLQAGIR